MIPKVKHHMRCSLIAAGVVSFLLPLTACLDKPIVGEVAGESLEWIATSVTTPEFIVTPTYYGDPVEETGFITQILLSDYQVACDALDRFGAPPLDDHTLVLTFYDAIQPELTVGEYRVGASAQDGSAVVSNFLIGSAEGPLQIDAISGVVVVSSVGDQRVEGEIHLTFPDGKLRGYFSSEPCFDL